MIHTLPNECPSITSFDRLAAEPVLKLLLFRFGQILAEAENDSRFEDYNIILEALHNAFYDGSASSELPWQYISIPEGQRELDLLSELSEYLNEKLINGSLSVEWHESDDSEMIQNAIEAVVEGAVDGMLVEEVVEEVADGNVVQEEMIIETVPVEGFYQKESFSVLG